MPVTYAVSDIVTDVRKILDQNAEETGVLSSNADTLELDDIIRQKILHAARFLLERCDVTMLGLGKTMFVYHGDEEDWPNPDSFLYITEGDTPSSYGDLKVWVMGMPDDYLRLLSLRMSDWTRSVHHTIPYESDEYWRLKSNFIGITGNPTRPAVAERKFGIDRHNAIIGDETGIAYSLEAGRFFEIFTSETGEVKDFRYIAIPEFETETELVNTETEVFTFPEKLYVALLYQTASLVETAYKNLPASQMFASLAMGYAGIQQQQEDTKK